MCFFALFFRLVLLFQLLFFIQHDLVILLCTSTRFVAVGFGSSSGVDVSGSFFLFTFFLFGVGGVGNGVGVGTGVFTVESVVCAFRADCESVTGLGVAYGRATSVTGRSECASGEDERVR